MHPRTTGRSKSTLYLLSNMMDTTSQGWLQMDNTSPENQLKQFTQSCFTQESQETELDTSELCNDEQIKKYQTLIGQLMRAATLERLDIPASVMTMSRFSQAPRVGHLQCVQRSFGYLVNLLHGVIRYRTHEPDYSDLPHMEYGWARAVYTDAREELPHISQNHLENKLP